MSSLDALGVSTRAVSLKPHEEIDGVTEVQYRQLHQKLADISPGLPTQGEINKTNGKLVDLVARHAAVKQKVEDSLVVGNDVATFRKQLLAIESDIEFAEAKIKALTRRLRVEQGEALEKSRVDGHAEQSEARIVHAGIRAQNERLRADLAQASRDEDVAHATEMSAGTKVSIRTETLHTFNRIYSAEIERTKSLIAGVGAAA